MQPQEITEHTSLRELKKMRERLKREKNDKFSLQLIEHRIKQLQERHVLQANTEAAKRMNEILQQKARQ